MMLSENDYYVYWPLNGYSRSSFSDLFENKIEVKKIPYTNIYYHNFKLIFNPKIRCSALFYIKKDFNISENFSSPLYDEKKKYWYRYNDGVTIDYQYNKISQNVLNEYIKKIKKLKFNKKILNTVDDFYKSYFDNNVIGLQVRTWIDDTRRQNMFDINYYKNIIKQIPSGKKIYITTDNLDILEELKNFTDTKIISYTSELTAKKSQINKVSSYLSADDDFNVLVELLLLSKCSKIYGSYLSNFPEVAWLLSECKAEIEIVNKPTINKDDKIYNLPA